MPGLRFFRTLWRGKPLRYKAETGVGAFDVERHEVAPYALCVSFAHKKGPGGHSGGDVRRGFAVSVIRERMFEF